VTRPPSPDHPLLRSLAAAAVLQRVRWGGRAVDVPLARPVRVDPDEVLLRLAEGGWLVLAAPGNATSVRAALRRWLREAEEGPVLAVILAADHVVEELVDEPPERPSHRLRVVFAEQEEALWDLPWPPLVDVLLEAAQRRGDPPVSVLSHLREREGSGWPERAAPPTSEAFERVVWGLAQAHDLVRLVRGEARIRLRTGGHVTVLASAGDPAVDEPALAAALARIAAGLAQGDAEPGLLVVDGPTDLVDRVEKVLGRGARQGRVNAIGSDGSVYPADRELAELAELALAYRGPVDLWANLEAGLARSRGGTFAPGTDAAGEGRLGVVAGLLDGLPRARLDWVEATAARLVLGRRELRVRWVGPEGGAVEDAITAWRLAALGARWTEEAVDLVLVGGDGATWDRARRSLPASPEGHVFHLAPGGPVRARAGLMGPLQATARALRRVARQSEAERRCTVEDLHARVQQDAMEDFHSRVADTEFQQRLQAVSPWATRILLAAVVVVWALQLRWGGTSGAGAVRMGALTGEGLGLGEPWRWLSAAFLHAAWWHLGLNALALWVLGRRLEALLGPERLVALFLLSCLGGSLLHEAFSVPGDVAVGASTGILGLLAAQGVLMLVRGDLVPDRIRRLLWREAWINGLIILAISLLPFVGGLAHLGGALAGAALVASGLLTWGVHTATPRSRTPTRVETPDGLRAASWVLGGVAVASVVTALALGRPWILEGEAGRVRDTTVAAGRLTLPLPGSAGAPAVLSPDEEGAGEDTGNSLWVSAGDPLRDGVRVEARVARHGLDEVDLDDVVALYGGGRPWQVVRAGGGLAAATWVRPPEDAGRLVHRRWLMERDGVVVDLSTTALPDAARSRLSGTWERLPAGVSVDPAAWEGLPVEGRLEALEGARVGRVPAPPLDDPALQGLLTGVARHVAGDPDAARDAWGEVLDGEDGRQLAAGLIPVLSGPVGVALAQRGASIAPEDTTLAVARIQVLERVGRYEEALEVVRDLGPGLALAEAQLLWHLGRDEDAAEAARRWWNAVDPWWSRPASEALLSVEGLGDPGFLTNRGWARFLAGEPIGCRQDSRRALEADPDNAVAAYNLALCTLVLDGVAAARPLYEDAVAIARRVGDERATRGARRDLAGLVTRGEAGASAMLGLLDDPDGV
jgi:rhomboid protease GluP